MSDTPNAPLPLHKAAVNLTDGTAIRACKGIVHIFAEHPGWCQCGREFWQSEFADATSDDIGREGTQT